MPLRLTIVRGFAGLISAIAGEIEDWNSRPATGDPPGGWAVLRHRPQIHMLRDLLSAKAGCAFNVRTGTLDLVARTVAGCEMESRLVPDGFWEKFIQEHLSARPESVFGPAVSMKGLAAAIRRTVEELRMAGVQSFEAGGSAFHGSKAGKSLKIAAFGDIFDAWVRSVGENGWIDRAGLFSAALGSLPSARSRLCAGRMIVLVPPFQDELEARLVVGLAGEIDVDAWIVSAPGASRASQEKTLARFRKATEGVRELNPSSRPAINPFGPVAADGRGAAESVPGGIRVSVFSAPGPEAEARETARRVLEFAGQGIAFNRMAVLFRDPTSGIPRHAAALSRAGIPFCFRGSGAASMVAEARALALLLESAAGGFDRNSLFEALRMADAALSALDSAGGPASADEWDSMTRLAGAARGRGAILSALDRLAAEREGTPEKATGGVQGFDGGRISGCRRGLEALFGMLESVLGEATWAGAASKAADLVESVFPGSPGRAIVLHLLPSLAEFDRAGADVSPRALARAVGDLFAGSGMSSGLVGREGVNLLPVQQAEGLDFDAVFVPGMALRRFPAPFREDPALLDWEREALAEIPGFGGIMLRRDRLAEDELRFAAAAASACRKLVLSYPGFDIAMGRAQAPSQFLLRTCEAASGAAMDFEVFMKDRVEAIPVFTGMNDRAPCDTVYSRERVAVRGLAPPDRSKYLAAVFPDHVRMRNRQRAMAPQHPFSACDGWISDRKALEGIASAFGRQHPFSPSALEAYAECPYRFYLSRVFGVEPLQSPEEEEARERIDPMRKGSLVHEILADFHRGLRGREMPGGEAESGWEDGLRSIAGRVFAREEAAGTVGRRAFWAMEKERLVSDMAECVKHDFACPDEYRPAEFEREFRWRFAGEGAGKEGVLLVGFADRVDLNPAGDGVRIVDYKVKAGKPDRRGNSFMGGRALQLPLYLDAAFSVFGKVDPAKSEAVYYFLSRSEGLEVVRFDGSGWEENRKTLSRIVAAIVGGIRGGIFPPNPGKWDGHKKAWEHCRFCDYAAICGRQRTARMAAMLDSDVESLPERPVGFRRYVEMIGME